MRLALLIGGLLLAGCAAPVIDPADTCAGKPARSQCWMKLESPRSCYVWNAFLQDSMTATWTGGCDDSLADGEGRLTFSWDGKVQTGEGSLVRGKPSGDWTLWHFDGRVENITY